MRHWQIYYISRKFQIITINYLYGLQNKINQSKDLVI